MDGEKGFREGKLLSLSFDQKEALECEDHHGDKGLLSPAAFAVFLDFHGDLCVSRFPLTKLRRLLLEATGWGPATVSTAPSHLPASWGAL